MDASLLLPAPLADHVGTLSALGGELRAEVDQLRSKNAQLRKRVSERTCEAG